MASNSLYGSQYSGVEIVQFQWFIFQSASSAPATPTGGSWNFQTGVGTPPSGWSDAPPASPSNEVWVSIALVSSLSPTTFTWSTPGLWYQQGAAGQVSVGTTSTLSAGSSATVANSGTPYNAILNFGIPQGIQGIQGPTGNTGPQGPTGSTGTAATVAVGTTTTLSSGSSATVANSGTSSAAVFNFGIPQGLQGIPGSAASIAVGTTTTLSPSSSATVSNSGSSSAAIFNFGIPQGTAGTAATIAVGTTTTLAPGSSATVTNSGTSGSATFNFGIPQGTAGTAATIAVGTTTTTAPGTSATVTNSGTSGAAVFNFSIPQGAGVPSGGTTGQFLYKNSSTNYDVSWDTLTFSQIGSTPTTLSGYGITDAINVSQKGVSNGVATLDNTGKVPTSQLPAAVLGAVQYQGSWNASTNTPTLTSSVGTQGYYYVVSTAGTTSINGINLWSVGDWIVFNGSVWQKVNGSSTEAFSAITVTGLTGYMYANGTSQVTASTTIPTTALSGTITNAQLANSSITINGTSTSLGGSISVGTVTSVTGSGVISSSGGTTPAISISQATTSTSGYLSSTDWNTFNGKGSGSVTSVSGTGTVNGITLTGTVTSSGSLTLGGTLGSIANSQLTNSSITFGATSVSLGSTVSAFNAISIGATTRSSGDFTTLSANTVTSTTPVLSFNAANSIATFGSTTSGSYNQLVIQNLSNSSGASTNYVISNNLGTDSTYYGEFGMNSSSYTGAGVPVDFFSINNGIYFSGHDGDITVGSGNGKNLYLAWGTSGQSAHVVNSSGAIGLNTNLAAGTGSGTTNFGTAGQVITSQGSSATPTWTTLSIGGGTF